MSAHLERARLLLAQSRPADAESESMLALAAQPQDPAALTLLALSRAEQNKHDKALEAAQEAVGLAPDSPYAHYVHAVVLHRGERHDDAFRAAHEALRLDPSDPDHFALMSSIELAQRRWPAALEAAESALALNPEHVNAANLRAMALVRLGRKAEAMETVDYALHRAPEDPFSHANQGWNCLHRNDPKKAQEHFREALRLDPELDYARQGMLEALKARNPIYRGMLAYFLWTARLGAQFQVALMVASYFGGSALQRLAAAWPQYKLLWWIVLGAFYCFIYLTWTAYPLFNLFLRMDKFGRHVLSPDQHTATNWFGAFFLSALVALAWFINARTDVSLCTLFFLAVLSICVAAVFSRRGSQRRTLALATGLLALFAVLAMTPFTPGGIPNGFFNFFIYGFLGFQILANLLVIKRG
jgi:tetratricopeptide (TPR) repeat protein